MDQYVTSEETVADPCVGPENPGPGPDNPAPAASSSESGGPEVVAVVPSGQQKSRLRAEKLERVKNQLRKSKPAGATAPSWAYFESYVSGSLREYALCKLCVDQQEFERAEIKYSQSPSNLLRHLNTDYPGHRAAHDVCVAKAAWKTPAAPGAAAWCNSRTRSPATLARTRRVGIKSWCDGWWRMPSPFR